MSHVTYSFTWQSRIHRCSIIRGIRESCHIFTSVAKKHHVTYSCLMSHLHVHMTWQSRIHRIWETCHIFTSVAKHRVTYSCLWRMNHITYSFTWQSCIHRCTIIRGIWESGHIFICVAISHTQVYHNPRDLGAMSHIHICRKTSRHIFMSVTNESCHIFIYVATRLHRCTIIRGIWGLWAMSRACWAPVMHPTTGI